MKVVRRKCFSVKNEVVGAPTGAALGVGAVAAAQTEKGKKVLKPLKEKAKEAVEKVAQSAPVKKISESKVVKDAKSVIKTGHRRDAKGHFMKSSKIEKAMPKIADKVGKAAKIVKANPKATAGVAGAVAGVTAVKKIAKKSDKK